MGARDWYDWMNELVDALHFGDLTGVAHHEVPVWPMPIFQ